MQAMTPDEFKENYPQYAHLEADQLWDAMTLVMMKKESVDLYKQIIAIHEECKLNAIQHFFIFIDNDQPYVLGKIEKKQLAAILLDVIKSDNELLKLVTINF
jgi:hypothetical protein